MAQRGGSGAHSGVQQNADGWNQNPGLPVPSPIAPLGEVIPEEEEEATWAQAVASSLAGPSL